MTDVKHQSLPQFKYGNGSYHVPEAEASVSASGAPMWFHAWDEFRCIPQYMDTVQDPETGEYKTIYRSKVPPSVIRAGFEAVIAKDIHREGQQPRREGFSWFIVIGLIVLTLVAIGSLYYSYNTFCATHPQSCGGLP